MPRNPHQARGMLDGVLFFPVTPFAAKVAACGTMRVPAGPGLGVELDRDALAALHEQYLRCRLRSRDDTGYMRRVEPGYERRQPRR